MTAEGPVALGEQFLATFFQSSRVVEKLAARALADPYPATEPSIQATIDVTSTTPTLAASPASVPAAISEASPGPGSPAPVVTTSTNRMAYSARVMVAR